MDIELKNVHKWFGKVHANDEINLKLPGGTIQGILGENGAGADIGNSDTLEQMQMIRPEDF